MVRYSVRTVDRWKPTSIDSETFDFKLYFFFLSCLVLPSGRQTTRMGSGSNVQYRVISPVRFVDERHTICIGTHTCIARFDALFLAACGSADKSPMECATQPIRPNSNFERYKLQSTEVLTQQAAARKQRNRIVFYS